LNRTDNLFLTCHLEQNLSHLHPTRVRAIFAYSPLEPEDRTKNCMGGTGRNFSGGSGPHPLPNHGPSQNERYVNCISPHEHLRNKNGEKIYEVNCKLEQVQHTAAKRSVRVTAPCRWHPEDLPLLSLLEATRPPTRTPQQLLTGLYFLSCVHIYTRSHQHKGDG
jgi:hypothetical protein